MTELRVIEIDAAATHPLRASVLRTGTTTDVVEFEGDHDVDTFHLGVVHGDDLVGVSTWLRRTCPHATGTAWQLRGMATDPTHRGLGGGKRLLMAGIERCRATGAEVVWARARTTALGFYEAHGFDPVGGPHVDAATGLEHIDIVIRLGATSTA